MADDTNPDAPRPPADGDNKHDDDVHVAGAPELGGGWFIMGPVVSAANGALAIKGYDEMNSLGDVFFSEVC
jgi:hypothetical protein